jgi:hypothetical protein
MGYYIIKGLTVFFKLTGKIDDFGHIVVNERLC